MEGEEVGETPGSSWQLMAAPDIQMTSPDTSWQLLTAPYTEWQLLTPHGSSEIVCIDTPNVFRDFRIFEIFEFQCHWIQHLRPAQRFQTLNTSLNFLFVHG